MAMADRNRCEVCHFKSGEGLIIICNHKAHFGMAMRKEAVCDYFEREIPAVPGEFKRVVIADKVSGEDA